MDFKSQREFNYQDLVGTRLPLSMVPFGCLGKPTPTFSYLKVDFPDLFISRGLGQGFSFLRFAAIIFG